ncbi:type II toxin-antitoxin system HicA family toxin [Candidatus Thiosymbion oneisti]|uniref:type II toxin-antitoxin system HicA family toxin n=1 Tax=Candidatus Thiosymbion oneisti TaxID=589554 RepID=UPI000B7E5E46|nr:type II toxin-antitoxin system HicA family toxin [Candidatus Thiosymbion oneisti]
MKVVSGKRFCRLLEDNNWELKRVTGSHYIFAKPGNKVRVSVPVHGNNPLKVGLQRHLIITYWSKENNSLVAEVPELPGCMADGKTYQEAVSNAQVIIQEWIDTAKDIGRAIPEPKGRLMYA